MKSVPSTAVGSVDAQHPWLGLASFTEETRAFFHGRDDEVAELARRVKRELVTVLFGQSGLGKTSILRAGLVPRLATEGYCPVYVRMDYGREAALPSEQVKQAIARAAEAGKWKRSAATRPGETLWEFLHHRDDLFRDASGRPLIPLLIFDQFEEVFTLAQSDDAGRERARTFLRELADLVENRTPELLEAKIESEEGVAERFDFARADYRILIALREDYLPHLEGLKNAMPTIMQNRLRLAGMSGAQALDVVLGPGRGIVRRDVARQIVLFVSGAADLANAEIETSLLSLVCRELNEARLARGHAEISADLLAGSRETILTEFYERTLSGQPDGVRHYIEDTLLTDSGYRENIAEERVRKTFAALGAPNDSLEILIGRRLLRVEERLDVRRVELTHDVLCGVVKNSRNTRRAREAKKAAELELAATRAEEARSRKALHRARAVAIGCATLAVFALGSSIFGYVSMRRSQIAEQQVREAADAARLAEAKRDDDTAMRLIRQAEAEAERMAEARRETDRNRQIAQRAQTHAERLERLVALYADAVSQPDTPDGRARRGAALSEGLHTVSQLPVEAAASTNLRRLRDLLASEQRKLSDATARAAK